VEPVNAIYKHYNADTYGDKVIALTFDDGPWDTYTTEILDILEQYGAVATFFTVGNRIEGNEDVVKRAYDMGNQIATHSYDHAAGDGLSTNLTFMSEDQQIAEITQGYDAIEAVTGVTPEQIIRAPGGNYYGNILTTLQPYVYAEIGWNIDTDDWSRPGVSSIVAQIESATAGDIILMHDGGGDRSQTVEALKQALPYLISEGYSFITIDQLMAYNDPAEM
ncbi:MAG: polysaccharide deacetylase family protein, partial [Eggerthellaceae bacterium]|nr:polysaccharide deacetylase family protein [Eggerthellaceae bacterium]